MSDEQDTGTWVQIDATKVEATLAFLGAITDNSPSAAMGLLICCIRELDERCRAAGAKLTDTPLEEIVVTMLRGYRREEAFPEPAGNA